ncbi:PIN domain-containing protein [Candidatus Woesearchaeota archaeon]|nr:PIN domain-containing protein [Candidatus Woesearchaeota archaeon]
MKQTDIKCLDSSVWLAYFLEESIEAKKIIEGDDIIVISTLSLFEIKKRILLMKKDPLPALQFAKQRSKILAPGQIITEKAAEISVENKLGAIDSLIYATAEFSKAELITGDNDFRGLQNVKIIA